MDAKGKDKDNTLFQEEEREEVFNRLLLEVEYERLIRKKEEPNITPEEQEEISNKLRVVADNMIQNQYLRIQRPLPTGSSSALVASAETAPLAETVAVIKEEVSPKPKKFIRASEDLVRQSAKSKKLDPQRSLFEEIQQDPILKARCDEHNILDIGLKATVPLLRSLDVMQGLWQEEKEGDYIARTDKDSIPSGIFSIAQYLEKCGIKKSTTKRGKSEYHGKAREIAIKNLIDHQKPILWIRQIFDKKSGKPILARGTDEIAKVDLIYYPKTLEEATHIRTMIKNGEEHKIPRHYLTHFRYRPSWLFFSGNRYILRPEEMYRNLAISNCKAHAYLFGDLLCLYALDEDFTKKVYYDTLAYNLQLESLLDYGKEKRLHKYLGDDFKIAVNLGYLNGYSLGKDSKGYFVMLHLNQKAFHENAKPKLQSKSSKDLKLVGKEEDAVVL